MAFLDELMGATAAPGAGPDLKQFLGPIMEAMATESRRAADPISRIGDVGSAVLGTVGSGIPYGQGLAALDKQRSDTIKGSAQLFLSMLGQERQLEQLKGEERRHQERMSLDRERLGETKRQHDITAGQTDRSLANAERRAEAAEARERRVTDQAQRTEQRLLYQKNVDMATASLEGHQKQELQRRLDSDKEYQTLVESGLYSEAGKRLRTHYLSVAPKYPKDVTDAITGFGGLTDSMNRMRGILKETDYMDRMLGPETRTRLETVYAQGLNQIRKLGDMGVLTPGEVPFAERQLPNPTDRFTLKGKDSILAGFDEVDRLVGVAIERYAKRTGISEAKIREMAGMGPRTSSTWSAEPPTAAPSTEPQTPSGVTVKRTGSMMVGGKNVKVYEGSDGSIYDFSGRKIK